MEKLLKRIKKKRKNTIKNGIWDGRKKDKIIEKMESNA